MGTWPDTYGLRLSSTTPHIALLLLVGAFAYNFAATWGSAPRSLYKQQQNSILAHTPLELWTLFPTGVDEETAKVQRRIQENQNPTDCEAGRYFVYHLNNYGMGSDLHMLGLMVGFAMQHNRTLLYHPETRWRYTSEEICDGVLTPDCFFIPLSRCQYMANRISPHIEAYDKFSSTAQSTDQFLLAPSCFELEVGLIPSISDWSTRGISWWRAQTTRYLVKPSESLIAWTQQYFVRDLVRHPTSMAWNATSHAPPHDAICIHVRHGDKFQEMTLHPMAEYLEAATRLADDDPSLALSRSIFLSTDDPEIIDDIGRGAFDHTNFTFYYTRYERRSDDISPGGLATSIGPGLFGSISVANLILGVHPHCKAFVQTTGSNWNRLINEIRKTDGKRQDATSIDLEPGEWRRK